MKPALTTLLLPIVLLIGMPVVAEDQSIEPLDPRLVAQDEEASAEIRRREEIEDRLRELGAQAAQTEAIAARQETLLEKLQQVLDELRTDR